MLSRSMEVLFHSAPAGDRRNRIRLTMFSGNSIQHNRLSGQAPKNLPGSGRPDRTLRALSSRFATLHDIVLGVFPFHGTLNPPMIT
jgi:hypothetical protein